MTAHERHRANWQYCFFIIFLIFYFWISVAYKNTRHNDAIFLIKSKNIKKFFRVQVLFLLKLGKHRVPMITGNFFWIIININYFW